MAIAPVKQTSAINEDATYRRVTARVLPILILAYIIGYIDRVNVGFAKLQMLQDLRFSETTYGLGAGIFFIAYVCCELPSNLALAKIGARRWLALILVVWGIFSASMAFVRTPWSFYLVRCLLGMAEAGLFPGAILYLTYWFPAHRRGRITALFMTAQPLSGLLGGPLSGWILQRFTSSRHLAAWQWLFLLEALPAVLLGPVLFLWLDDGIQEARWLSDSQQRMLLDHLDAESARKQVHPSILSLLRDGRVWLMGLITFTSVMGLYGMNFWLPTIIQGPGTRTPLTVGLLTMIPYGAAVMSMLVVSRSADRTGERRWHLALSTLMGGCGLVISVVFGGNSVIAIAGLTLATAGIITSQPLFWSLPTTFLAGTAAAAGIALINAMGNFAGFVSPYLIGFLKDRTGSTSPGMYLLAFALFLGSALTLRVPAALVNGRRDSQHSAE